MKVRRSILLLLVVLWVAPAFGQSCAMCYQSASAADAKGKQTLNRAVLVLLVPPLGFMSVGVGLAFRYSRKRDAEREDEC
jgi:hypothetical protein